MPAESQLLDLDFEGASKILNVLIDPRSNDPSSPVIGQHWFNTTLDRARGYDGSNIFTFMRLDGNDTVTGLLNYNPTGSVPFTVAATKTSRVDNLNADRVDGYHADVAATASTLAARDASGQIATATPTLDGSAANKAYVDAALRNQDIKYSSRAATTAALPSYTFSNNVLTADANGALPDQDGVTLVLNNRLLVKDETGSNEKYNGIYEVTQVGDGSNPWKLTRTADADVDSEVTNGLTTHIEEGTANGGNGFSLITPDPITLNTTALEFTITNGGGIYSPGNGMVKVGNTFHFGKSAAYAVGDIPYCGTASGISFLSAGATGTVMKGQGTGNAPVYAAVDLTQDVTGILPIGEGGTGTNTQFTQGAVVIAGASGNYTQDPTNFFYNSSNQWLGLLTNAPAYTLDINGAGAGFRLKNTATDGTTSLRLENDARLWQLLVDGANGDRLRIRDSGAAAYRLTIDTSGKFGFLTDTPVYQFEFHGQDMLLKGSTADGTVALRIENDAKMWQIQNNGSMSDSLVIRDSGAGANRLIIDGSGNVTISQLGTHTGDSVLCEASGVIEKRSIHSGVWAGDADTLDGQEGAWYQDLENATGDTDDISEGLTNLFYTDARARAALSSAGAEQIAYNNTTGVIGLGTEAARIKAFNIGDGVATDYPLVHNFDTRDVTVEVYKNAAPYPTVHVYVERDTADQVTVKFPSTMIPTTDQYRAVVSAANG